MTQRLLRRRPLPLVAAALLTTLTACSGATGQNTTSTPGAGSPDASATSGPPPHVMVVVLENQEYSDVIGNPAAPYVNKLADQFGLATQYYARTHPSLPNYLDLIAGSQMDIHSDCTDCTVDGDTLVDQLAKKKIHWTAYMGGMPSVCYDGAFYPDASTTGYAKKHNPFVYFDHLRTDPTACQNDVPDTQLPGDLQSGKASPFLFVSPSLCDDGHNTSSQCGLGGADKWLSNHLGMVMASSWYTDGGIIIVTWDEGVSNEACCNGAHGGHIATLVISKSVKPGARLDTPVDHAGTLRTIEALYGLSYLNEAADPQSGDLMPLLGRKATG
jgi:hypothetical protein